MLFSASALYLESTTYKNKPLGMLAKTTFMSNSDKNACISTYTFLGQWAVNSGQ